MITKSYCSNKTEMKSSPIYVYIDALVGFSLPSLSKKFQGLAKKGS